MNLDPWSIIAGSGPKILSNDLNYSKILAAKHALKLLGDNSDLLMKLCLACSESDNFLVKKLVSTPEAQENINKVDAQGFTPLIYAICFNAKECVDILLNVKADPNLHDTLIGYTPLMWATYLEYTSIVEALLGREADPYLKGTKRDQCAIDLIKPGSAVYEFYKTHNYLNRPSTKDSEEDSNAFYKEEHMLKDDTDSFDDHLRLQTAGIHSLTLSDDKEDNKNVLYKSSKFIDEDDVEDDNSYEFSGNFDFNQVLPKQYIQFNDESITGTIDYIFTLYKKYSNKSIFPASIVYQCLRYASNKLESPELAETFLDLFLTRVRTVTGTRSGVVQLISSDLNSAVQTDIVLIGYWISCLNHLYYFMLRDGACNFFKIYPKMLQDIISTSQPLICQLSFSLDAKLEPLLESCILDYSSVPDMAETVYKSDWKIFKHKTSPKSTYEDIIQMLYPPSLEAQMRPSPLKIIQTMGALLYVLELHHINDVIKQQCFSGVLYWLGTSLFNRILASKKYNSRVKALQIRLNLSYIQDWLRTNNLQPYKPDTIDFKDSRFPDSIVGGATQLKSVTRFNNNPLDPMDSTFYYNPLYKIGQFHLMPVIELLEWLQIMTGLRKDDSEFLKQIVSRFDTLNTKQLLMVIKGYNYEIEEEVFPKVLKKFLKALPEEGEKTHKLFYTSSDKLFLNPGQVFPITLPSMLELLHQYGADFEKIDTKKLRYFQPHLPIQIVDDLDEIYDQELNNEPDPDGASDSVRAVFDDENDGDIEAGHTNNGIDDYSYNAFADPSPAINGGSSFKGTAVFSSLTVPTSAAHRTWDISKTDEDMVNPWT
ncbi:hypothetical protein CANARDRAFT_27049 [[Candida] arabinofermentans NRRL YB-2248]|uniref:Dilute domain-containing protein n=1 Tax=[Candida] arabinofermentans NRRL YB-2248 TaxID=983967 RepID=A0A1E4T4H0_9ASCO|nr:hypothetical protein CANARDRAFT_27049 [[Candida] arabinofermentans NRRL YB-2248]